MRPSKEYMQVGFKRKTKTPKQDWLDYANRMKVKENIACSHNRTETNYLLETQSHPNNQQPKLKPKPLLRKRLQSFEESSIRRYTKSYLQSHSHRSRSKSKLDERLDEMLINQKVKQQIASQKRSRTLIMNTADRIAPTEVSILGRSAHKITLSKHMNEAAEQGNTSGKKTRSEDYIINELSNIIGLIDGIFGVSRSQKLVTSFRQEKCLSIPSLIATIKTKLQTAAKDSKGKSHLLAASLNS